VVRQIVFVALVVAAGSPAFAQSTTEAVRVIRTPAPMEDPSACAGSVDCTPDLAGGQVRPSRTWSVRSSAIPADVEPQPYYPVAVIADVEADGRRKPDRHHRRDRRRPPR
jgi:hypothetical protein